MLWWKDIQELPSSGTTMMLLRLCTVRFQFLWMALAPSDEKNSIRDSKLLATFCTYTASLHFHIDISIEIKARQALCHTGPQPVWFVCHL